MPDVFTKAKRSEVMSRILARGNRATEVALAGLLRLYGIKGWRRHQPIFGRPDFVFASARVAVFVDGCFWHGCPKHSNMPVSNRPFWRRKLLANKDRDRKVSQMLRLQGWRVLRIWEHDLQKKHHERCLKRIRKVLELKSRNVGPASKSASRSSNSLQ